MSALVNGFPDSCEDGVLSAISNLQLLGFLKVSEFSPKGDVYILPGKKNEALTIVNSDRLVENESAFDNNYDAGLRPWIVSRKPASVSASLKISGINTAIREDFGPQRLLKGIVVKALSPNVKRLSMAFVLVIGILGLLAGVGQIQTAQSPSHQLVHFQTAHEQFAIRQTDDNNAGYVTVITLDDNSTILHSSKHVLSPAVVVVETYNNSTVTFETYVRTVHELPQE